MSLTNFIKKSEVKKRIKEDFPNQGTKAEGDLLCEPNTEHYSLIGTAFDYLARFFIEKHSNNINKRTWTAERGVERVENSKPEYAEIANKKLGESKELYQKYLIDDINDITNAKLVGSSLDLARLESEFRGAYGDPIQYLGDNHPGDVDDLKNLSRQLKHNEGIFTSKEAHLNPAFGPFSIILGGADADVIIEGNLVDFKTSKYPTFKTEYWNQLIGYAVLVDCHNEMCQKSSEYEFEELPEIESLCVYFSRYGEMVEVDASNLYNSTEYEDFRSWFVNKMISDSNQSSMYSYLDIKQTLAED